MLYDRWREIAKAHASQLALVDCASARRWTFDELARAADRSPEPAEGLHVAEGIGADFIIQTLVAWRYRRAFCPVEPGQRLTIPAVPLPLDCAHLKSTSGTAGRPRFVAFTEEQLAADASNIVSTMQLSPGVPNLAAISLAHSYGFSNLITPLLLHGVPLILCSSPLPEAIRAAARDFEAIALPGVPALWQVWSEAGAIPPNTRIAISAGAPLPVALEGSIFSRTNIKVHNFYGSTECGGIAYDRSASPRVQTADAGAPLDNVSVTVDTDGRLVVTSAAVGMAYWPDADSSLRASIFRSADLAEVYPGGIRLLGRETDLINVAGRKTLPEPIEEEILRSGMVEACVVVGVPAQREIDAQMIVAIVRSTEAYDGGKLRQYLSTRLANWQIPHRIWEVADLQADVRGKISRRKWQERYLAAHALKPTADSKPNS